MADLEAIIEEVSAIYDKKSLLALYNVATSEPFSFLYLNLIAKDRNYMFYMNFTNRLIPNS